jgi:hypothetical protein
MSHKILKQLIPILLPHHNPRHLNNIPHILHQLLPVPAELLNTHKRRIPDLPQRFVDLLVIGHAALAKGFDDTEEVDLAIDVCIFVGIDDGADDGAGFGVVVYVFGSSQRVGDEDIRQLARGQPRACRRSSAKLLSLSQAQTACNPHAANYMLYGRYFALGYLYSHLLGDDYVV